MSLTPKQKNVLEFIQRFLAENGYSPSYQEIADAFEFRSRATVQDYVRRLRESGYLETDEGGGHKIQVQQSGIHLPLLGKVAAGRPIEHYKHQEFVEVPSSFIRKNRQYFCLQVSGDSMIGAGILDGDTVIIRRQTSAEDGQIVVAAVDNQNTLKRLQKRRGRVELDSANPRYQPIVVKAGQDFRIEGVLSGVLRQVDA